VEINYDPAKSDWNARERGIPFDSVSEFDFETALYFIDDRADYGETRRVAVGELRGRELRKYDNAKADDRQGW